MKLGIFGDSYAAFNDISDTCLPWPRVLGSLCNKDGSFGRFGMGGSSHWYSYEQFIKNYKDYEVIVFSHTNSERWPCTKIGIEGKAFNIGYFPDKDMDEINKFRKDIFSSSLLQFISLNIFKEVNQKCREEGIYLINIFPFDDDYEIPATEFPIIKLLDSVSHKEQTRYQSYFPKLNLGFKDKFSKLWYGDHDFYPTTMINNVLTKDLRECHLNCKNNKRFAHLLHDMIEKREYNKLINCMDLEWDIRDNEMDEIYAKSIGNR
jgi:hypothetical protein